MPTDATRDVLASPGRAAGAPRRGPSPRRLADLARIEARYGVPEEVAIQVEMNPWEYSLLRYSKRDGRYRDTTMLIPWEGKLVCIAKHGYPDGIARPPSGGVVPGEPLDAAAMREAWEETGLRVQIDRYLLRVRCDFSSGRSKEMPPHALAEASTRGARNGGGLPEALAAFDAEHPAAPGATEYWESHVFWATPLGGDLKPIDTREIKSVVLVDPARLEGTIHPLMEASGVGGFRYRVDLQKRGLAAARAAGLLPN
ncbi:MAG TPA: NUDIX hydrolase [Candidatus Thermoplasmatota archaeon]|nr:NUDIX hydrolase [Candidatus Thermoplasmatota archaeon]